VGWTTPRTWVAAEEVTSSLLNAHLRDNLRFLHGSTLPRVRVETVVQDTGGTAEATRSIIWQRAAYDPVGVWGGGATLNVPTGADGVWRVGGAAQLSPSASGWSLEIELDGIAGGGTRLCGSAAQVQTRWTHHRCIPHVETAVTAGQTFAFTIRGAAGSNGAWLGWFQWGGTIAPQWRWNMSAAMWARLVAI